MRGQKNKKITNMFSTSVEMIIFSGLQVALQKIRFILGFSNLLFVGDQNRDCYNKSFYK